MADYISLTCPSCGAKLERTQHHAGFVCPYCGQEHVFRKPDDIVFQSFSIDDESVIKAKTTLTEIDVNIDRLQHDIEKLVSEKNRILEQHACPTKNYASAAMLVGVFWVFLLTPIFTIDSFQSGYFTWIWIPGVILMMIGVGLQYKFWQEKKYWDVTVGFQVKELDDRIEAGRAEIRQLIGNEE